MKKIKMRLPTWFVEYQREAQALRETLLSGWPEITQAVAAQDYEGGWEYFRRLSWRDKDNAEAIMETGLAYENLAWQRLRFEFPDLRHKHLHYHRHEKQLVEMADGECQIHQEIDRITSQLNKVTGNRRSKMTITKIEAEADSEISQLLQKISQAIDDQDNKTRS
jgi:copper chaperone CopZ